MCFETRLIVLLDFLHGYLLLELSRLSCFVWVILSGLFCLGCFVWVVLFGLFCLGKSEEKCFK